MVIVDTSVIIDHLRRVDKSDSILAKLSLQKSSLAISVLTIQEIYQGKSTANKDREQELKETIEKLQVIPYSFEIAKLAGELTRDSQRMVSFPDAAIAATAIVNKAKLLTLNTKDFEFIPNLNLYE